MKWLLRIAAIVGLAGLLASQLGEIHPIGDSLAVGRLPMAICATLLLLGFRYGRLMVFTGVVGIATLAWAFADRTWNTGPSGPIIVYQKNLLFKNQDINAVSDDIITTAADVVMLQEVTNLNRPILERLSPTFPTQILCPRNRSFGVAVLSKYPRTTASAICTTRLAAIQVTTSTGPAWVVSLHLHWPYPFRQDTQLKQVIAQLSDLQGPIILAGDLNMVPDTRIDRALSKATGTQSLRNAMATFFLGPIPFAIDRVFAQCGTVRRGELLGSDHHGLIANVGIDSETCGG